MYVAYSSALYSVYKSFCETTGRKPVGDSEFGKRFKRAGYGDVKRGRKEIDGKRFTVRKGLNLTSEGEACWKKVKGYQDFGYKAAKAAAAKSKSPAMFQ